MKRPLLFSLCIILLLSISAASLAASIGEGPVELNPDEFVSITPVNSSETYQVPETTALGALDGASRLGDFEYQVAEDLPADQGNLSVIAIADLEGNLIENEMVDGVPNNWTYWVNDVMGTTGAALETVADGDVLTYTYGPPSHTMEDASYTLAIFVSVIPTEAPEETPTETPVENVTPTETPEETSVVNVTITSPEEGASIPAGNVTVEVDLTDFTLVEPTGQPNAPGEGHLHYYLDAPIPTDENEIAIPETGGYAISTNTSYTWEDVAPGEHNLSVQVVNNDHTPLVPLTFALVNVTAETEENVTPTETPVENVTPEETPTPTETPVENVTPEETPTPTETPVENVTPTENMADEIVAGLSGEMNLTTFTELVDNSTIGEELDANRTYLVCAPTNVAFAGLGNQTLSAIQNDTELLSSILGYHIIEGDYTLEELATLCLNTTNGEVTLPTVEGTDVTVSLIDGDRLAINNIVVITQFQITNNIIIYVLDGVLVPPGTPIPTPSPTPTETAPTPTETPVENVTPTPTETAPTPTETPVENVTPTPTETTPTPTETPVENVTPTPTETTPTPTETPVERIDLQLYEGWNFVSIPRQLAVENDTAARVFADVDTGGRAIYTYTPAGGFESMGEGETLRVLEGYWVYSTEETTVELVFSTDPVRAPALKTLNPGWNAIGYSDLTERSADETLTSVEDIWVYVVGYDAQNQSYRPALINNQTGDRGEEQSLSPMEGYWLFVREDGRLAAISA